MRQWLTTEGKWNNGPNRELKMNSKMIIFVSKTAPNSNNQILRMENIRQLPNLAFCIKYSYLQKKNTRPINAKFSIVIFK